MYSVEDAGKGAELFCAIARYDERIDVCGEVSVCFRDAGHLLGSSFIEMWVSEGVESCKLIFSGDLGNGNRALIRDPEKPVSADYLIIESTYGDREHDVPPIMRLNWRRCWRRPFPEAGMW